MEQPADSLVTVAQTHSRAELRRTRPQSSLRGGGQEQQDCRHTHRRTSHAIGNACVPACLAAARRLPACVLPEPVECACLCASAFTQTHNRPFAGFLRPSVCVCVCAPPPSKCIALGHSSKLNSLPLGPLRLSPSLSGTLKISGQCALNSQAREQSQTPRLLRFHEVRPPEMGPNQNRQRALSRSLSEPYTGRRANPATPTVASPQSRSSFLCAPLRSPKPRIAYLELLASIGFIHATPPPISQKI